MKPKKLTKAAEIESDFKWDDWDSKTVWNQVISTGSTLLDLAISGERVRGGGIPGGKLVEIFGKSSTGKTALLSCIGADALKKGGEIRFDDPEGRLDREYSSIYGLSLRQYNYKMPDTVTEMFDNIKEWEPADNSKINVTCEDSLAALSTLMEMEDGDKRGQRRAKEFSEGFRKFCRYINKRNFIMACSNQQRQGEFGLVTPGGFAVEYYSSLRIHLKQGTPIERSKTIRGQKVIKTVGRRILATIVKNSIGESYREAHISLYFRKGIDDIRENLLYYSKFCNVENKKDKLYIPFEDGHKEYGKNALPTAIKFIQENEIQDKLKENVIGVWEEIDNLFME